MTPQRIDEARAYPIQEVVGRYVGLRKSGRSLSGCCPFHEDSSPSLHVYPDDNRFFCFGCHAHGDAIAFVRQYEGCGFPEAIDSILGSGVSLNRSPRVPKVSKGSKDNALYAAQLWRDAFPIQGTLGERYLMHRGIELASLAHTPPLRFNHLRSSKTGEYHPAVLSRIDDASGSLTGIQRTFLSEEGLKHPVAGKTTLGELIGNATKLSPTRPEIALCEGLEDGLTVQTALPDVSVWVTAGTTNLSRVVLPADCQRVVIAADNDNAGSTAAHDAVEAYLRQGFDARIIQPDPKFKDFNEQLQKASNS